MHHTLKKELEEKGIKLNPQQYAAATHKDGPHLIISCPGSGKTTTLVIKLYVLIKHYGIDPKNILTMTFSRTSAKDMKTRFVSLFPELSHDYVKFSTIHSFALSVINNYQRRRGINYTIIEGQEDQEFETIPNTEVGQPKVRKTTLLKKIYFDINEEYITDDQFETLLNEISFVSNRMISPEAFDTLKLETENFKEIYCTYKEYKQKNKWIDYDDMLSLAYNILKMKPEILYEYQQQYKYICLDECQDTSVIQFQIIKLLAYPNNNLCLVGDDDQTLYSWRGAEPNELLEFQKNYPGGTLYYMETNYRSSQNIVNAANEFIKRNKSRYEKAMKAYRGLGAPIQFEIAEDEVAYAKSIAEIIVRKEHKYSEYAVLYRNNNSSIILANEFIKRGIPFHMKDRKLFLFDHWITKDIKAMLTFSLDYYNVEAFEEIYYKMNLYLNKSALDFVKQNGNIASVFQILLQYNKLTDSQKSNLEKMEKKLDLIKKLVPKQAIEYLLKETGYVKHLEKKSNNHPGTIDDYMIIIETLAAIAAECKSVNDYFEHLNKLESNIAATSKKYNLDAVNFSTLHSSKGCEYSTVFMTANENELPPNSCDNVEEEARVFYVGITRAKNNLYLYSLKKRNGKVSNPSIFYKSLMQYSNPPKQRKKANISYHVNSEIMHSTYGRGYIVEIKKDKKIDICICNFYSVGSKSLSMKYCLENKIITIVN